MKRNLGPMSWREFFSNCDLLILQLLNFRRSFQPNILSYRDYLPKEKKENVEFQDFLVSFLNTNICFGISFSVFHFIFNF